MSMRERWLFIRIGILEEDEVCFTRVEHLVNMRENIIS
jgi:hypothetical protein